MVPERTRSEPYAMFHFVRHPIHHNGATVTIAFQPTAKLDLDRGHTTRGHSTRRCVGCGTDRGFVGSRTITFRGDRRSYPPVNGPDVSGRRQR